MSLMSSIGADEGNAKFVEWIKELELAYRNRDWEAVAILIAKMREFYFSE